MSDHTISIMKFLCYTSPKFMYISFSSFWNVVSRAISKYVYICYDLNSSLLLSFHLSHYAYVFINHTQHWNKITSLNGDDHTNINVTAAPLISQTTTVQRRRHATFSAIKPVKDSKYTSIIATSCFQRNRSVSTEQPTRDCDGLASFHRSALRRDSRRRRVKFDGEHRFHGINE